MTYHIYIIPPTVCCIGFVHQSLGNLKVRAVKYMSADFTEGVKGYKMWHPTERKFIVSKDVTFRE